MTSAVASIWIDRISQLQLDRKRQWKLIRTINDAKGAIGRQSINARVREAPLVAVGVPEAPGVPGGGVGCAEPKE
jgi:hypothetical protein